VNARQELNYQMFQKYAKYFYDIFIDTSVMNPHYVPEEGPCVVVANHRSDTDPFLLMVNIKRPINWLGASYLWNIPIAKDFISGLGAIPVSKYQSVIRKAFEKAEALLNDGQAVGIFPEGWDYISANQFDWSVGKFQSGFARIALAAKAPVVPIAMMGLDEIRMPQAFPPFIRKLLDYPIEMQYIKDRCVYRKLHINVGRPIPCPENADPEDKRAVSKFTEKVNQVVVDLYNKIPKDIAGFEKIVPKPAGPRPPEPNPYEITEQEIDDATIE
jgi:1-acyl-sn-glycerol-3-phosphate acyltransferase